MFKYYNIKHVMSIPYNPTGQVVVERYNHALKKMLIKQKGYEAFQRQIV